ncbi:MAG TPA: hypothetical protein VFJ16_14990 [Longimicrobium sp.]|nr:hypothetical protein [Longimicrobium sp.]
MSRMIEVSDETYERLESLASASGSTPAEWVAATAERVDANTPVAEPAPPESEEVAGPAGPAASGGQVRSVALPDDAYARVASAASAAGMTVAEWVAECAPRPRPPISANGAEPPANNGDGQPPRTLADEFVGLIGLISSGRGDLSQRTGELFGKGMAEKRRRGHL